VYVNGNRRPELDVFGSEPAGISVTVSLRAGSRERPRAPSARAASESRKFDPRPQPGEAETCVTHVALAPPAVAVEAKTAASATRTARAVWTRRSRSVLLLIESPLPFREAVPEALD
jgi:hypothetical protein